MYSTTILKESWGKDRKRYDAEVLVKPFFAKNYTLKLRVLSTAPIKADNEDLIDEVIKKKKEWKQCKKSCSVLLARYNCNAYILNQAPTVTEDESTEKIGEVLDAVDIPPTIDIPEIG